MNPTQNPHVATKSGRLSRPRLTTIALRCSKSKPRFSLAAALALGLAAAVPSAQAGLMAYEGFNYPVGSGNLSGQSGGFGWNGSWQTVNNGSSSVLGGSLAAGVNAPSGYDALSAGSSAFTPNGTRTGRRLDTSAGGAFGVKGFINGSGAIGAAGKTLYISFMQQPNAADNNYYEFELHRNDLGDPGRIGGVGNDTGGSGGIYLRTPSVAQTLIGPGSAAVSFYVVRIDFLGGNDTVYVYQNPTSATEPATPTLLETSAGDMSFNGISFGAFANGRTVTHDEVRLGETWADVVSPGTYSTGIWGGGGADNNWSTPGNWDNNVLPVFPISLTFGGNTRLANTNNLIGIGAQSITFGAAAGAFTLNGNNLELSGNIGFSANPAASITQTINLPLTAIADLTVDTPGNGNILIKGDITGVNQTLTQTSAGNTGTLTLAGSNTVAGFIANGGTNRITGSTTVAGNGGSRFCLANGNTGFSSTLVIENGANLSVNGNFVDSGVIGRDGGIGTVIQNGGTFSFNPNNVSYLFVGASSSATTRAEYHMNGGTLDLNNLTLALGLSANGATLITGLVSQVSGTITNVGKLDLGAFTFGPGRGIYNLSGGSIYIGSGGIVSDSALYNISLGGGTVGAYAGWSSSLNLTLSGSNGPVTFDTAGNNINLTGTIAGPGGFKVIGGGILELGGANTFTGDMIVNAGTLQFDTAGSSAGVLRLASGATVSLNFGGNYIVAGFNTNGVALPNGTYNTGNLPGFILGTGNLLVQGVSTGLWTGSGANNDWSTAGNWDHNVLPIFPIGLTFAGNTRLHNTNDLAGVSANSITFDSSSAAFILEGNSLGLNGNIAFNGNPGVPVTQTLNLPLVPAANFNVDTPANGNLLINGDIAAVNNTLFKVGGGTLTMNGNNTLAGFDADGGTNVITGNTTVTGTGPSRAYVANGDYVGGSVGTLVIQTGASFAVNGSFADAYVVGRDTGVGRIVQNGGTFDFNPANQTYMFIAAGNNASTRGEYDMNGGVLNMNGKTLGVGLGVNVAVTGVVNQVSGVITNVGQIFLDSFFSSGYSIYNLSGGNLYLGSGGITVQAGGGYKIYLGGGTVAAQASWSSALNMTLTGNNGPVTFNPAGNTILLSGVLSGSGGLTVSGGGTLELSSANSYKGTTLVNQGTLKLDAINTGSGALKLASGTTLNLNFSGTMMVTGFSTNNVSLPLGTYNAANLAGFITGAGAVQVVAGIPTSPTNITFSASGGHVTVSWPANYLGWILQQQINSLNVGLGTNWVDVPGTASVTSTNIAINPATPAMFLRLRYPTQ